MALTEMKGSVLSSGGGDDEEDEGWKGMEEGMEEV